MVLEDIDLGRKNRIGYSNAPRLLIQSNYLVWEWNDLKQEFQHEYTDKPKSFSFFKVLPNVNFGKSRKSLFLFQSNEQDIHVVDLKANILIKKLQMGYGRVHNILFGDPDNDGREEILVHTSSRFTLFDISTLKKESEFNLASEFNFDLRYSSKLWLTNIDEDPLLEIVANSGEVFEITHQQIGYNRGNNTLPVKTAPQLVLTQLMDLNHDGRPEIINSGFGLDIIEVYESPYQVPSWTIDIEHRDIKLLKAWDFNNDGMDELITGPDSEGDINCIDVRTNEVLWDIHLVDSTNVFINDINITDLNHDGQAEMVVSLNSRVRHDFSNSHIISSLKVFNPQSRKLLWESSVDNLISKVPYTTGDIDNDGDTELIMGLHPSEEHRFPPNLFIFDAKTLRLERTISDSLLTLYDAQVTGSALIADLEGDGKNELILGINHFHFNRPRILILDGESLELKSVLTYSFPSGGGSPNLPRIGPLEAADYNGNGKIEIVTGLNGARNALVIFDSQDGSVLDEVPSRNPITRLAVWDTDNDGKDEIFFTTLGDNRILNVMNHEEKRDSLRFEGIYFSLQLESLIYNNTEQRPELLLSMKTERHNNPNILVFAFDPVTLSTRELMMFDKGHINSVKAVELDTDAQPELIFHYEKFNDESEGLAIFDSKTQQLEWENRIMGNNYDRLKLPKRLMIADLNGDKSPEILVGLQHQFLAYSFASTAPYFVSGTIFEDEGNCEQEANNIGLKGWSVIALPGRYFGRTDSTGKYTLRMEEGEYEIFQIPPTPDRLGLEITPQCNSQSKMVELHEQQPKIENVNFANTIEKRPHLTLDIGSNRRRYCAPSQTIVNYCNQGIVPSEQTKVYVRYPTYVIPLSTNLPYEIRQDGTLIFNIGKLNVQECGSIIIQDSVVCDNFDIVGISQCTEAWITPGNSTPTIPTWSGASLSVANTCNPSTSTRFVVRNVGTGDMEDSTTFKLFNDEALVYQDRLKLNVGDSVFIDIADDQRSYQLEVEQVPAHPFGPFTSTHSDPCLASSPNPSSLNYPQAPSTLTRAVQCLPITAALDPNDKQVVPAGVSTAHIVRPGAELEYTIRFQNTGTDTAFRVVLVDTLSEHVDIGSLREGIGSHPYTMHLSGKGKPVLTFTFDPIVLPDSNVNEPASNGFVTFSLIPKPETVLGTQIQNFADIYFDYNPPIRTNTVWTTIDTLTLNPHDLLTPSEVTVTYSTTVSNQEKITHSNWQVFPNPSSDQIDISFDGSLPIPGELVLIDPLGRVHGRKEVPPSTQQIVWDISSLAAGVYYLQWIHNSEIAGQQMLVIQP